MRPMSIRQWKPRPPPRPPIVLPWAPGPVQIGAVVSKISKLGALRRHDCGRYNLCVTFAVDHDWLNWKCPSEPACYRPPESEADRLAVACLVSRMEPR